MTGTNINMRSERMPIGDGYSVTFSFASGRLEADWQPKVPYGRKGRKYLPAYRRARLPRWRDAARPGAGDLPC